MSEERKKPDAEIQRVLKLGLTEIGALRKETRDWGLADFDYTEKCTAILAAQPGIKATVYNNLKDLRLEVLRKNEAKAAALRHRDTVALLSARLDDVKRSHWTAIPTFLLALAALIFAWLAWYYPGGQGPWTAWNLTPAPKASTPP